MELYEQCQLHNNQATAPSRSLCPTPTLHTPALFSELSASPVHITGLEAMKRPRGGSPADGAGQCLPEEVDAFTDPWPGKGRKACLQYVSGQTGHYPLGRAPETLEPSSDTFLQIGPSRELRPDSSPETVPVCLEVCGDPQPGAWRLP